MEFERRDLLARAARDRLAELTSVSPRQLAGLDAMTAGAMARAILYPERTAARHRRLHQEPAAHRRRLWLWAAALLPLPILLLVLGTVLGGTLRSHLAPSSARADVRPGSHAAARTATAPPPAASAPAAADPVAQAAMTAVAARLGPGAGLSDPAVTAGDHAAYVRVSVSGVAGTDTCLAYLHEDGTAWSAGGVACGRGSGFAPAAGVTLPVRVPGGCANLRATASASARVLACLASGSAVALTGPPVYRDGHTWWPATWNRLSGDIALEAFGIA